MKKSFFGYDTNYTFFGYDTDYTIVLCCFHRLHSVVLAIPKEGLAGPAHQSSFGYDNDKDLTARFPMTHLMCHLARDETVVCDTLMLHFNITLYCLATHVTVWELSQISLSLTLIWMSVSMHSCRTDTAESLKKMQLDVGSEPTLRFPYATCINLDFRKVYTMTY